MKVIALLISLSLTLALIFLYIFYVALKKGQFDDLESPSLKMLDKKKTKTNSINQLKSKPE